MKKSTKVYVTTIVLAILVCLIANLSGCSTMSMAKHKKVAWNIGYWIEEIEILTIEKCNKQEISEADCEKILGEGGYVNTALDAYDSYIDVIFAVQESKNPPEALLNASTKLMKAFSVLVKDAIHLNLIDESIAEMFSIDLED